MRIAVAEHLKDRDRERLVNALPSEEFIFCEPGKLTQETADSCDIIAGIPGKVSLNRPDLKAVLLSLAGSDTYAKEGVLHANTKLSNASGSYGKAIAEHTVGMIVTLNKGFKKYAYDMRDRIWEPSHQDKELYHSVVLIVGLGDIGYEIARRLKAFECTVIGVKRTAGAPPRNVDELYTTERLDELLPRADFVISCLPNSKETYHLYDRRRFLLMKKDALFVNVGRGSAVRTEDLVDVLRTGHLFGAALDVLEEEPLSADNELWDMENVFITPHISGTFKWASVREYFTDLLIRNIRHITAGEPPENEVDPATGYRKVVKYRIE